MLGVARYNTDVDPNLYLPSCIDEMDVEVAIALRTPAGDLSQGPLYYTFERMEIDCRDCEPTWTQVDEWRACEAPNCENLTWSLIHGVVIDEQPYAFGAYIHGAPHVTLTLTDSMGVVDTKRVSGQGMQEIPFTEARPLGYGPYTVIAEGDTPGRTSVSPVALSKVRFIMDECLR